MKYRISHSTHYEYSTSVSYSHNEVHLIPRNTLTQKCVSHEIRVSPKVENQSERTDSFGNAVSYFSIFDPHKHFTVVSESEVEMLNVLDQGGVVSGMTVDDVQQFMRQPSDAESRLAVEYLLDSPYIRNAPSVFNYAAETLAPGQPIKVAVADLMRRIFEEFEYDPHFTDNATPLETVLDHKKGVCQDFAHLAIACLRSHGLAARYVSGYLETLPPPGEEKLVGSDASHAWFSVYVPGAGWLDYDPTNNQIPTGQHITVAWGRDYSDVTPLKGILYGGGSHQLAVSVDVRRID